MIQLWSIQAEPVWQTLQEQGVYRCPPEFIWEEQLEPYAWLADRMRERVGPPPTSEATMVWAWRYWAGTRRPRPDLRRSSYAPRGTPLVMLELLVPANQVLLTDFLAWLAPMNGHCLAENDDDWDDFDHRHKTHPDYATLRKNTFLDAYPPKLRQEVEASWQKIFDLNNNNTYYTDPPEEKPVQATLWELQLNHVQKVRHFKAK